MIYREIEHNGDSFVEREYEGTAEEIATLIKSMQEKPMKKEPVIKIDEVELDFGEINRKVREKVYGRGIRA